MAAPFRTTSASPIGHRQSRSRAGSMNRPGLVGDSWSWKIKDGVHANRSHSWEADDASVFV